MSNTHMAYVVHDEYDPPRKKMIASGSESFCRRKAIKYRQEHVDAGPIEVEPKPEPGDPFRSQWPTE